MENVEQKIVDALVHILETIPSFKSAWDGKVSPISPEDMPAANVFTPKPDGYAAGMSHTDHELDVTIVIHCVDKAAQREIRSLVADVYAAIGNAEKQAEIAGTKPFGIPEIIKFSDPASAKKVIQQGEFIGSAQIALAITYRTARWAM